MLRHFLRNLAQVAADVGQAGPGAQQAGGQRVAGLVGDPAPDVEAVDPVLEALVEPVVGQRDLAVPVAEVRGEQRHRGAFAGGGRPVVPLAEQVQGLALARLQQLAGPLRDADRRVVVADLGLVMPEHGQASVAAQAVQAEPEDLAAAAAGDDDGLPGIAQAAVERVVVSRQGLEVGLVGQRPGDAVGERRPGPLDHASGGGHRGDEAPVQAEPFGLAGLQRPAQEPPGAVEDGLPGVRGHDRRLAVNALGSQRGQPVELALPLVGGELVHVPGREGPRVVAPAGSACLQEGAQLESGPAGVVEGAAGARA